MQKNGLKRNTMQKTGLKRNTIDKFYTSPSVVNECIQLIKQKINIQEDDVCIEPSAGNGSFINGIKSLFKNYHFYDLEPEDTGCASNGRSPQQIIKQDYLKYDYNTLLTSPEIENPQSQQFYGGRLEPTRPAGNKKQNRKVHVIGNPPFGRQSSLAIKFIKKSSQYCDSISFILPKSFKKDSLKKHFPLKFHLICEFDLPENSFIVDKNYYDVPCVFQIWIKKDTERPIPEKLIPTKFKFVKKDDKHDISFRRVGSNAGHIDKKTEKKSVQSHYFIKFDIELTNELFNKLTNINFNCKDNTCGPKSISKQELIKEFNKLC